MQLVNGDGGAGQCHGTRILQRDVDAVGPRFQKSSPQVHLALCGRRNVIAHDAVHRSARGVRHNGARRGGDAEEEVRLLSMSSLNINAALTFMKIRKIIFNVLQI